MIWSSRSKAAHAYSRWRILFPLYYVPVWGCGFDCWHRGGWWCASRCRTRMGWKRQPAINIYQSLLCTFSDHYQPSLPTLYIYIHTCVYVYNVCLYLCVLYIYTYADWDVWSLLRFPVRTLWFQQCRPRCPGLGLGTGAGHMAEMGENSERRFHGTWILVTAWSIYVSWYFLVNRPVSLENGAWTPPNSDWGERERER